MLLRWSCELKIIGSIARYILAPGERHIYRKLKNNNQQNRIGVTYESCQKSYFAPLEL